MISLLIHEIQYGVMEVCLKDLNILNDICQQAPKKCDMKAKLGRAKILIRLKSTHI